MKLIEQQIELLIKKPDIADKFDEFLKALQSNLNSSIEKDDAIEMLAEHMITKPVFDTSAPFLQIYS